MKRLLTAITTVAVVGALVGALAAPLNVREARWAAQGYETPTPTPGPSPTPTATPRPFVLTPRPTSTGLAPRPATPTPQTIAATPGPCTIALSERSATCKTSYYQPVTWTLRLSNTIADQRVVTSSVFNATSRVVFTPALAGGSVITVAPRWQGSRAISVITLTGQISGGDWISGTTLTGQAPAGSVVTLKHHRWISTTQFYRLTVYTTTANASGVWTRTVPSMITSPRDYWQVWHYSSGRQTGDVDTVVGVLTRRLYLPTVHR